MKKFPQVLLQRVPPVGRMVGEFRARQLEELTDRGECQAVLEGADAWLATYSTDAGEPTYLSDRRAVLFSKARCLARLGRTEEAAEARTQANQ